MKFFEPNENITSYKIPIVKIIACVLVIALTLCCRIFIPIDNVVINIAVIVVGIHIMILCFLFIHISFGEIILLSERIEKSNLKEENTKRKCAKKYSVESVINLLEKNEIIEMLVVCDEKVVEIGASSDSVRGGAKVFDKKFYIDETYDVSIEDMKNFLIDNSQNGEVLLISIDGVLTKDIK